MRAVDPWLRTPLHDVHLVERARMVEFGGWEMPVEYRGIRAEHASVREAAGLFDLSHMGEIEVAGPGALGLVDRLVTHDVASLVDGQARYACLCREDGKVLDDLLVYRFGPERFWLVVNASNRLKAVAWVEACATAAVAPVSVSDRSLEVALLAVQGPRAAERLQPLTSTDLEGIGYYRFAEGEVAGLPAVISRTGYTGEDGFELYVDWGRAEALWGALRPLAEPVGLGARDTLRLEAGYPLYGHELDEQTSPLEAGLGWVVKLSKPDFLGREALARERARGSARTLVGLEMQGRPIPRQGYPVEVEGRVVGSITSGTFSPTLGRGIALASVEPAVARPDQQVEVVIRDRREGARVVRPPFVKGSVRR